MPGALTIPPRHFVVMSTKVMDDADGRCKEPQQDDASKRNRWLETSDRSTRQSPSLHSATDRAPCASATLLRGEIRPLHYPIFVEDEPEGGAVPVVHSL